MKNERKLLKKILMMKIIESKYIVDAEVKQMYKKFFDKFEKIAKEIGGTFILVRNHLPMVYYCEKPELFEYEAETADWKCKYQYVLISPNDTKNKIMLIENVTKDGSICLSLKTETDVDDVIKRLNELIKKLKINNTEKKIEELNKDFMEM